MSADGEQGWGGGVNYGNGHNHGLNTNEGEGGWVIDRSREEEKVVDRGGIGWRRHVQGEGGRTSMIT